MQISFHKRLLQFTQRKKRYFCINKKKKKGKPNKSTPHKLVKELVFLTSLFPLGRKNHCGAELLFARLNGDTTQNGIFRVSFLAV